MSDQRKAVQVQVTPQADSAVAFFSNFLAVSRLGTEIQFDFLFLDLNQIAATMHQFKEQRLVAAPTVQGKTVAKIIMPAASFVQLREQFERVFQAIEKILPKVEETENERRSTGTTR